MRRGATIAPTGPRARAVAAFAAQCDQHVEHALESARIDDPAVPSLRRGQAAYTILEHEQMHQETLMYIMHQLAYDRKRRIEGRHEDHALPLQRFLRVEAGTATLGTEPDEIAFGWDNEFRRTEVPVTAFDIAEYPVTNGDWLRFIADGGPIPQFWKERDGEWLLRGAFEEIALPRSWPVYVTHEQAEAYAKWTGTRLPSEAEYHRAAFGTPSGEERPFPWGDERPAPAHGNFDFERFDPEPVDAHPRGTSAWGVADLVGNGWEWTSTPFAPFPGSSRWRPTHATPPTSSTASTT